MVKVKKNIYSSKPPSKPEIKKRLQMNVNA